jgi:hypothetical protein
MLESMAVKQREAMVRAQRDKVRDLVLTALLCLMWCAVGLGLIAWSVHTTDDTWGHAAFYAGIGLGNAGIIYTLLAAYRRGEKRGDW